MGIIDSIKDAMRGDDDPKKASGAAAADADPAEQVDPVEIARRQQESGTTATAEIPASTPPVGSGVVVSEGTPPAEVPVDAPGDAPAEVPVDAPAEPAHQDHEQHHDQNHDHDHDHEHGEGQGHGHAHPDAEHEQTRPRHVDPDRADHQPRAEEPAGAHAAGGGKHAHRDDAGLRTYTVVHGDTLSAIGEKFGVSYQEIARLNHVENPDLIFPGQVFKIPS